MYSSATQTSPGAANRAHWPLRARSRAGCHRGRRPNAAWSPVCHDPLDSARSPRPPFGRHTRRVERGACPVDLLGVHQPLQQRAMQTLPPARLCQSPRRRQHVMPLPQPISCGRSSQPMPLLRTKMIPVKTLRSSNSGRPPLGLGGSDGSSGTTMAHNSSLTRGLLMVPVYTGFVGRSKRQNARFLAIQAAFQPGCYQAQGNPSSSVSSSQPRTGPPIPMLTLRRG
jgi:hypothetical protein